MAMIFRVFFVVAVPHCYYCCCCFCCCCSCSWFVGLGEGDCVLFRFCSALLCLPLLWYRCGSGSVALRDMTAHSNDTLSLWIRCCCAFVFLKLSKISVLFYMRLKGMDPIYLLALYKILFEEFIFSFVLTEN